MGQPDRFSPVFFHTFPFCCRCWKMHFASGERNMRAHEFCFGRVSVYTVSTSLEKTFACLENSPWDKVLRTVRGWVSCWRCLWPLEKKQNNINIQSAHKSQIYREKVPLCRLREAILKKNQDFMKKLSQNGDLPPPVLYLWNPYSDF